MSVKYAISAIHGRFAKCKYGQGMGQLKGPKSHANRVEYLKKYSVIRVDGALLTLHFIKLLSYSRTEISCSVFLVFSHDSIIIYE